MCEQWDDWITNRRFSTADHFLDLRKENRDGQQIWDDAKETKLKGLVKDLEETERCLIIHAKNAGSWLTVLGTTVSDTVILAT